VRRIYFDHAATTRTDPRVVESMMPYLGEEYGNPSSLHDFGVAAKEAVDRARSRVAALIAGSPDEIFFTASGSESNNAAIKGAALAQERKGRHVIVSAIEHFSVLHSVKFLERLGFTASRIGVDNHGVVDPDEVARAIRPGTTLISIMHANAEVGTIEPILEIAKIAREKEILFHTDAVATVGTIPVDVKTLGVDLLSLAGQQFYGPKGAAALYVRKGIRIFPLIDGGIQEGGRRAGTENVPGIVGLGRAADLAVREMSGRMIHDSALRDRLIAGLTGSIDHLYLNGHPTERLPGNVHVSIEFIEGESMLLMLNQKGIAVASGSSCTSRALKSSHVLVAMGVPAKLAQATLQMTLGVDNTEEEVDYVLEVLPPIISRLREMSPLYEKGGERK
jgi:cysteine desulfurase